VIDPADGLTTGAANSLLKTLEEPPGGTLIILVSEQPAKLPATVRSRCQNVPFAAPPRSVAEAWLRDHDDANWALLLEFAAGAPLAALELAAADFEHEHRAMLDDLAALLDGRADPVAVGAAWKDRGAAAAVAWLQRLLNCAIRVRCGAGEGELAHRFMPPALRDHLRGIKLQKLFEYSDQLAIQARRLDSPLNAELVIESMLLPWAGRFATDTAGSPIP
jgi:DNA polymerase-3 subunit delta'